MHFPTRFPSAFRPTVLLALATLLLAGCGRPASDASAAATTAPAAQAPAGKASDPLVVDIPPAMAPNFKVETAASREIAVVQEVVGRIDANEKRVARIGAAMTGRITEVLAEVGDTVRAGQTLARIASPELTAAQLAFLRATSAAQLAERAVDRARQLIQADVIGSAEVQRREAELAIARAESRAAADQLRLMGVPADAIAHLGERGALAEAAGVTATLAGVVTERTVSKGQVSQPGDPLFTVADLSTAWVVGALPERTARAVALGQQVEVAVPALGERKLAGKVVFISDTVSPDTRTVTIRTEVDNRDRALKPQMLATLRIAGPATRQLTVPAGAVVRENDRDHVFLRTEGQRYRLTPVELGPAVDGQRPVLQGLQAGAAVVVEGAFHMNNERKRAELE
ncbi:MULTISPECIES: efflux RND transporter periplasmic adaptor subunit [Ramlibacter]|uniref:Efflux RND transporter periplasmic adaptor subunit n=1 Tax=Ramlibacter pinisoli TaxID=2682844 RepID=A0A6N8IUT8_9BURK|nr:MULTISPECIES: efflux RND transporter periplasmic adaptor subunit [Ramlibacter]MBA2964945.1 efflux RND transporter periplasmic adaptor subunit [Ramlibacter sp. CGMCC 1.13660]MVQ29910.1 efflux RND transporter periplasmic adaptor subunit [Ramlibacter pinisoli]